MEISLRSFRSPEMAVSLIVGAMRTLAEQDSRPAKTAIDFGQDDDITVLTVTSPGRASSNAVFLISLARACLGKLLRARFESLEQRRRSSSVGTSGLPAVAFRLNRSLGSSRSAFSGQWP